MNNGNPTPTYTLANPFTTSGTPGTLSFNGISADLLNAYNSQYSLSVERQVAHDIGVRISYIGSKGSQIPYIRNVNQPLPSTTAYSQSRRPYPLYNNISFADSGANSLYSALQTVVTKRFSRGLLFNWPGPGPSRSARWTIRAISSSTQPSRTRMTAAATVRTSYSVPRHQWMNQVLYELPLGKGKLLGGWQLNALLNLATGNYLNPQFSGSDPSNTNTGRRPAGRGEGGHLLGDGRPLVRSDGIRRPACRIGPVRQCGPEHHPWTWLCDF